MRWRSAAGSCLAITLLPGLFLGALGVAPDLAAPSLEVGAEWARAVFALTGLFTGFFVVRAVARELLRAKDDKEARFRRAPFVATGLLILALALRDRRVRRRRRADRAFCRCPARARRALRSVAHRCSVYRCSSRGSSIGSSRSRLQRPRRAVAAGRRSPARPPPAATAARSSPEQRSEHDEPGQLVDFSRRRSLDWKPAECSLAHARSRASAIELERCRRES